MQNPYEAPRSELSAPAGVTPVKLYSAGHIAWASFLGAPLAGFILMAINYRRFGESRSANLALIGGFAATIALISISFFLPAKFPNWVIPAACTYAMYQFAKTLQGRQFTRRLANGDTAASGWAATGVGLASAVTLVLVIFAIALVAPEEWFAE